MATACQGHITGRTLINCGEPDQMGTPVRSDAAVGSKGWEPRPRGFLSLSVKSAIFGVFLLCTCVFVLVYDVRYAQFLLFVGREYQKSAQAPRVIDARLHVTAPLYLPVQQYHNVTDDQKLGVEMDDNATASETDYEAPSDMDLSVEEDDKDVVEELEDADFMSTNTSTSISEKMSTEDLSVEENDKDDVEELEDADFMSTNTSTLISEKLSTEDLSVDENDKDVEELEDADFMSTNTSTLISEKMSTEDLSVEENDKDVVEELEDADFMRTNTSTLISEKMSIEDLSVDENDKDVVEELEDADFMSTNTSTLISEKMSTEVLDSDAEVQNMISVSDAEELIKPSGLNASSTMVDREWDIPRVIPKNWKPSKNCATAEEMGADTVGNTRAASLRVRAMIRDFIAEHGAERVGNLTEAEFCQRGFVLGQAQEDGFGNNMYKVLTAAGLAIMLNRSLIIAERGGTNPTYLSRSKDMRKPAFGDYLDFSNQAFTVREVRRLWAINECATKYKRPLIIHNEALVRGYRCTRCICDDWTTLTVPILQFKGAIGSGAIQLLLKNEHPAMRRAAAKLLGNPAIPSSRPNTFGELFRAFIAPNADIREAVQWALKGGPDPDITLHLRMLHSHTRPGPAATVTCINRIRRTLNPSQLNSARRPRVVVVTDTPAIIPELQKSLGQTVEVVHFNYLAYAKRRTNKSEIFNLNYGMPAHKRLRDWGAMPRWVAMVDFFLAARARTAVVSGAYRRVSTTYAQFIAALANANTLDEEDPSRPACEYYSSLQSALLTSGLASQSGWGHTWRPFGGRLGCRNQATQCARTALMPYAWWDAPWQSPISADLRKMRGLVGLDGVGQVSERAMNQFCAAARRRPAVLTKLRVPRLDEAIAKGT